MSPNEALAAGFRDPIDDAQRIFRAAMNALARPGSIQCLDGLPEPPAPFNKVGFALVLALTDHETPVWLDRPLSANGRCAAHVRFHTGAPVVSDPLRSTFAVVTQLGTHGALPSLATGSLEYPDRSTTLILQVEHLWEGDGLLLRGPGIESTARLAISPLPQGFIATMAANHELFPCGVDVLLASDTSLAALPRTTVLE
ncbi:MAG: phosphonate C-P lyase system protein PhnH [Proteobacteria bacterium]|nr:phosphonate C-P lyase system protein PhnH [Pseudomonadota bacterium]